jgi:PAS domain S-box-containing protein
MVENQAFRNRNKGLRGVEQEAVKCKEAGPSRKCRRKLSALYQDSPLAYFTVGIDGIISDCNKMAQHLCGYTTEELSGRNMIELFAEAPESTRKLKAIFDRFVVGEVIDNERVQIVTKDGSPIWGSLTVKAMKNVAGKINKGLFVVTHIYKK